MPKNLEILRHSAAHLMAAAVQKLYSQAKFGIGPTIENGFYYDIDFGDVALSSSKDPAEKGKISLTPSDLPKIEKAMQDLVSQDIKFEKEEMSVDEAIKLFKELDQPYKVELLQDIKSKGTTKMNEEEKEVLAGDKITIYKTGKFVDLCRGPHVDSTGELKNVAIKLDRLAGAYWRGSEKNKMLTRIYGLAFESKKELKEYLEMLDQAAKRDHRKLGQELELFMFDEEVGPGLPLWMPNGAIVYQLVKDFAFQTYLKNGYKPVVTPHIASLKLWEHSGHTDFFAENMYSPFGVDDDEYKLKPMNCPLQVTMYKAKKHSYRELPLRWTEMGTVYRYERSGVLQGLTRVRGFTQDDAHIICTPEQLEDELSAALDLTMYILKTFGFKEEDMEINLSTCDPQHKDKFIGDDKMWNKAQKTLAKVVKDSGFDEVVKDVGGAVFYGPKIDIKVADAIGRKWQLSTIQFDFNLPSRFNMTYSGSDGKEHTPFMIHRALLGSLERFMGVLIEHYAGAFPLWLAPVQAVIITVGEKHEKHAQKLAQELIAEDLRVEVWNENETVGNKIRKAIAQKIPYMLVIGDKETQSKNLHVRQRGCEKVEEISKKDFIKSAKDLVEKKSQEL